MRTDQLHHIRRFNRLYTEKLGILDRNVFGSGLGWAQARALMLAASGQARTPADITRLLGVDKSYVSRLVDSLVRGGYLTKKADTADRRSKLLEPTAKGRKAFSYLEERSDKQLLALFSGLSDPEQEKAYQAFTALDGLLFGKSATPGGSAAPGRSTAPDGPAAPPMSATPAASPLATDKTAEGGWFDETLERMPASRLLGELELRAAVFAVDQKRIYQDPDETDRIAHHICYMQDGQVLAYARVFASAPDRREPTTDQDDDATHPLGTPQSVAAQTTTQSTGRDGTPPTGQTESGTRTAGTRTVDGDDGTQTLTQVSFGRVVTARQARGKGLGAELMRHVLGCIARHYPGRPVYIHAQQPVIGFYQKFGFTQESEPFLLAGSPHVLMEHTPLPEGR